VYSVFNYSNLYVVTNTYTHIIYSFRQVSFQFFSDFKFSFLVGTILTALFLKNASSCFVNSLEQTLLRTRIVGELHHKIHILIGMKEEKVYH